MAKTGDMASFEQEVQVQGLGFRFWGLGFRFGVKGSGCWVWDLGLGHTIRTQRFKV